MSEQVKFYNIKDEIRILGVDDAPFDFNKDKTVPIVGTVFRGGRWLDGVIKTEVEVDGIDSTDKLIERVNTCKFKDLRVIMLDGLGFGGFNLVDIRRLFRETGLPVIVVVRNMPDFEKIGKAIRKLKHEEFCRECIRKAGEPRKVETRAKRFIHIQYYGISFEDAEKIVRLSATRSLIPEPIRAAHLIASGFVLGESRGGA